MEYAIETFSLTKVFSDWWGRNKVKAVDNLNLQVHSNEVFGLLGPNGSGKTTTLKMLLGLLYPTKGRSLILGGEGTNPKINARIGFLPEESYLYQYLNARETLDFYGRLFKLPPGVRKNRIESLLEMVGLKAMANRAVGTFSKGMARRIGLAQALINDPDLLILDEPTAGLDPIGTRQIKDLIIELAKRGKTILLCSHLLADVEDVCDRIAILYGGRIQAKGKVTELLQQTGKKQIITSYITDTTVEKIKQIVENEHADFTITSPMDKLESFFIRTVTDAQMQGQSTSGAISDDTTKIGDFLTGHSDKETILEKLVSAPVSETNLPDSQQTEQPEKSETADVLPDEQLLGKLTSQINTIQPKPSVETQKPITLPDDQKEQAQKNILDQLTNPSKTTQPKKDKKETDQHQGDSENA